MARLTALPSLEIIRGLKGIIDFYLWKGLPCARAWPRWRPARQSEASKAAALFFGAVVKSYSLLGELPLAAYRQDAAGQPRSARDVFVSGIYGNLHEADVSDFLSLLIECRDFLSALTAILNALDSVDLDELVVNVDESVLPPLAATSTIQTTQLTALQKLDDLQDALQSKGLDRLLVRGMDQVFTYKQNLLSLRSAAISGADGWVNSHSPPAGQAWAVTNVTATDVTTPTTRIVLGIVRGISTYYFDDEVAAFPAGLNKTWGGLAYLEPSDVISALFIGGLAGDTCIITLTGHIMTLET